MKFKKLLLPMLALIAVIAAAGILYPRLSARYAPASIEPVETAVPTEAPTSNEASSETEPSPEAEPDAESAAPMIDFTVYDADGNAVRLSDLRGKPTVVNFWATWCRYCVEELPAFDRCYNDYNGEINFMIVDLTDGARETQKKAAAFAEEQGYTFPLYFDTDLDAAYTCGIQSIPMTLLLDADGQLLGYRIGLMDEAALRQALDQYVQS